MAYCLGGHKRCTRAAGHYATQVACMLKDEDRAWLRYYSVLCTSFRIRARRSRLASHESLVGRAQWENGIGIQGQAGTVG